MAVPIQQFVKQLEDSGLLTGETINEFIPPNATPKDAEELARALIGKKKLTKFQAEEISRGKGKSLRLGNYILLEKIGAGGMGQVFKARHSRMDRLVAVKILPPATTKDKAAIARFEREVKVAARISHPNIVAALDADCANGIHFLVMELVEGHDLSALVKKNGPFSIEQGVEYTLQAARGLEAAHAEGIVHRDIKPANLLLDKKGTVKILDMGLARLSDDGDGAPQADLTSTGAVMGTVDYMAPEQALDTKTADARADIYALGCSLHFLLTAKATYGGDSLMKKLLAHRDEPIPSLRAVRPEVSEQLETVFRKMVAKTVHDRYQSMTEVIVALAPCRNGNSTGSPPALMTGPSSANDSGSGRSLSVSSQSLDLVQATGGSSAAERRSGHAPFWADRRRQLAVGGGLAVIILVAVVGLALSGKSDPTNPGPPADLEVAAKSVASTANSAGIDVAASESSPASDDESDEDDPLDVSFPDDDSSSANSKRAGPPRKKRHGPRKVALVSPTDLPPAPAAKKKQAFPTAEATAPATAPVKTSSPLAPVTTPSMASPRPSPVGMRVNLLPLIDVERDARNPGWKLEETGLVSPSQGPASMILQIPYTPPPEYELRVTVEPLVSGGYFTMGLVVGSSRVGVSIDRGIRVSGLDTVDGLAWNANETSRKISMGMVGTQPLYFVCRVQPQAVVVLMNGRMIVDWEGDSQRLKAGGRSGPDPTQFSLQTGNSGFTFSRYELIPLGIEPAHVPEAEALAAAAAKVQEVIAESLPQGAGAPEKKALAIRLESQAALTDQDDVQRFALLSEALKLTAAAGDLRGTVDLADNLSRCFAVEPLETLREPLVTLAALVAPARLVAERREFALQVLELAEERSLLERYDWAAAMLGPVVSTLQKTKELDLQKEARLRETEVRESQMLWNAAEKARQTLATDPGNGEAHAAVGRYLALARGKWEAAVQHFAQSDDAGLQAAAKLEVEAAKDPQRSAEIGAAWLDVAEKSQAAAKVAFLARARRWFELGTDGLTGPALAKLQTRFKKADAEMRRLSNGAFAKRHPLRAHAFGGHWYEFVPEKMTWPQARKYCQDAGGELVCLETAQECQWVYQFVAVQFGAPDVFSFWTGGTEVRRENVFTWVSGNPMQFADWDNRKPNPINAKNVDCAVYVTRAGVGMGQFKWSDEEISNICVFVCEWDR